MPDIKFSVDQVPYEDTIAIRLRGEDIKYQASNYAVTIYLDKDMAEKIAFQVNALLQDVSIESGVK